jgi:CRP-like cAMP-binding protein
MARKPDRETAEALSRVTDFDAATVEKLAGVGRPVNIPEGWAVVIEGTPADKAYIILDGTMEVRRKKEPIAELSSGDIIGEMALVNGKLRNATVVAKTPVKALHLTDTDVAELLEHDPDFASKLQQKATERLD